MFDGTATIAADEVVTTRAVNDDVGGSKDDSADDESKHGHVDGEIKDDCNGPPPPPAMQLARTRSI